MSKPAYANVKTKREIAEHLAVLEGAVFNATKNLEWWRNNLRVFKKEKKL